VIEAGDIHLADDNQEQRLPVLVVSNSRFTRLSGRAIVAPAVPGKPDEVPFPWRIEAEGHVFAIDLLRSIPPIVSWSASAGSPRAWPQPSNA
jgi:mRNA-degrading endonuclease toxin of MazEF toxin-antitoxin module